MGGISKKERLQCPRTFPKGAKNNGKNGGLMVINPWLMVITLWLFNSLPWKIITFNRHIIYKWAIFHSYVKYLEGKELSPLDQTRGNELSLSMFLCIKAHY